MYQYKKINILLLTISCLLSFTAKSQYISVDTQYNAQQLVDKFVGTSNSCISITNASVHGPDTTTGIMSYGYFEKGTSNFSIDKGIILSTGRATEAIGPNNSLQNVTDPSWIGDADLNKAVNIGNSYNATVLKFDFISLTSNKISFDYMFLSEQYLRQGDKGSCDYTDGFAFLIRKKGDTDYTNLALIPGTNIPIRSNTVRGGGESCSAENPQYFGQYNYGNSATNFNGETKILTATTNVIPGDIYEIKLVIADQGNGLYDSAVFLKAGSFVGNKDLGSDQKICAGSSYTIDATTANAIKYTWYKDAVLVKSGIDPKHTVSYNNYGLYEVEIELASGCVLKGQINISQQVMANIDNTNPIRFCNPLIDNEIVLQDYISQIITNYTQDSSNFDVRFFDAAPSNINNPGAGLNLSSYKMIANTQTLYIWVKSGNCTPEVKPIIFIRNPLSQANIIGTIDICDNLLSGNVSVNLADYLPQLASNIVGTPTYYLTELDAKKQQNPQSSQQNLSGDKTFYIRFQQNGLCENVTPITFHVKSPKKSNILKDITICKDSKTDLDAGAGFDSYLWNTNATTASITNVPVGDYWVDLGFNGCVYRQHVKVIESEPTKISAININGSTVTIDVESGTAPYTYALDNGNYQSSNTFTDVKIGLHTIYVKYGNSCGPIAMTFTLFQPLNVITPNDDGRNDRIDYSDLSTKTDARFQVIDRYGKKLFDSNISKKFIWDGKYNGIALPTDSYWYIIDWKEFGTETPVQKTGWILLKNRN